jgi:hypothetical protein
MWNSCVGLSSCTICQNTIADSFMQHQRDFLKEYVSSYHERFNGDMGNPRRGELMYNLGELAGLKVDAENKGRIVDQCESAATCILLTVFSVAPQSLRSVSTRYPNSDRAERLRDASPGLPRKRTLLDSYRPTSRSHPRLPATEMKSRRRTSDTHMASLFHFRESEGSDVSREDECLKTQPTANPADSCGDADEDQRHYLISKMPTADMTRTFSQLCDGTLP